ncbi:hypothetical protein [Pseudoxanthomonas sp. GM95]|uniref:hypothetical protein n=1 Tax=Pseudoxanthomonas sp. GM95 TaxID=1881043 RepID=UPI0011138627|nr:hypothetical protein [Pseudoxanthomonas sp. GM95]
MFAALTHFGQRRNPAELERLVQQAYPLFESQAEAGHAQLLQMLDGHPMDLATFLDGLLADSISTAPRHLIDQRKWLASDGGYSYQFQDECAALLDTYDIAFHQPAAAIDDDEQEQPSPGTRSGQPARLEGTREQAVVASIAASASQERIAVEAYAGTGKTYLVRMLQEHLPGGFTYVAPSQAQIHGYERAAGKSEPGQAFTLNGLAWRLLRGYARDAGMNYVPSIGVSELSLSEQAQLAGIGSIGNTRPEEVMRRLYAAIRSWCYTDDTALGTRHFLRSRVREPLEIPYYIAAAYRLWDAMFAKPPRAGRIFDIWHAQVAKWLVLQGACPSTSYGTLLVDEAHDLPPSWISLLGSYQSGCILMGDPHQKLQGYFSRPERFQSTAMLTSLRIGLGADRMIEQTLGLVPDRQMGEFRSARDHITRLRAYDSPRVMPDRGLRLYGNEWAMLEAALRLKAAQAPIGMLTASRQALEKSVRNASILFESLESWHGLQVNGCSTLDELVRKFNRQGLQSIVRLFERGFTAANFTELATYTQQSAHAELTLGLIDHSKNLEFDTVALSPCCYEDASRQRGFLPVHASYLGMSRARHELWVPGDTLDRLHDLNAAGASDLT